MNLSLLAGLSTARQLGKQLALAILSSLRDKLFITLKLLCIHLMNNCKIDMIVNLKQRVLIFIYYIKT